MNNPTQGSVTDSVTQKAHTFPDSPTFPSRQQDRAALFLAMGQAALKARASAATGDGAGALPAADHSAALGTTPPRVQTLTEITAEHRANRAERRRKHEEARQEAEATLSLPRGREEALRAVYAPPSAQVTVRRPAPRKQLKPKRPPAPLALAALLDLVALRPARGKGAGTAGAGRLAALLDVLSRHALGARGYGVLPSQITLHLSNELLAAALRVSTSTVWRWAVELEKLGYLHFERHYTGSQGTREQAEQRRHQLAQARQEGRAAPARAPRATPSRKSRRPARRDAVCDGTLYAVRLHPGHRAHLSAEDLAHQWRDLDADRKAGRTAHAAIQAARLQAQQDGEKNMHGSTTPQGEAYWLQVLKAWAVTPGYTPPPLLDDPCIIPEDGPETVQDVVYALPLVETAHPDKRPALVGILAATLARCLHDEHSRRHYCRLIWDAHRDTIEGRAGLQVLAAQLARLDVDRREWVELRNPAALLVARLHSPPTAPGETIP